MPRPSSSSRWFELRRDEVHRGVFAEVERISAQQAQQRLDIMHYMELYSAGNVAGLGPTFPGERLTDYLYDGYSSTRFNMVAAIVDTAESMCAQTPAVPVILTTGGDFGLMRRARKKTQVLQGQMTEIGAPVATSMFRACAKTGTGIAHGYVDEIDGLPKVENVHPLELLIEHSDGINKDPRNVHRWSLRSRDELKACYPKFEALIDDAPGPGNDAITAFFLAQLGGEASDMIEVVESHHVATGKRIGGALAKNGVHTVCIKGATLFHQKNADRELPYVALRYRERDYGYFGAGLVESCRDAQNRVNDLIARVQRGQDIASNVVLLNPIGAQGVKVKHSKLTNEIGIIIDYDPVAGPPTVAKLDGTQYDLQEQIDREFQRALLVEGLSSDQANGDGAGKGLTSGVAVRAQDDVQTRRLVSPIKRFQDACIGVAKLIARLNDKLAERDPEYSISGRVQQGRSTFLKSSRWADLEIPEGTAQITMMPMSALPTTPQGKWAAVMEWIQAGFISQQYAMQLIEFPDLDSYADAELAHIDIAQWQVEQLLDGEDVWPVPRQLLPTAVDIATKAELKAITMGAGGDVIDAFERFLQRCEAMIEAATKEQAKKQAALQAAAQPPAPQGAPQPGGTTPAPAPRPGAPPGPAQLVQPPPMRPALAAVV